MDLKLKLKVTNFGYILFWNVKNFEKFNFCDLLRIPEIYFNRFSFLGSVKLYPLPFVIRPKMFIKRGIKKVEI